MKRFVIFTISLFSVMAKANTGDCRIFESEGSGTYHLWSLQPEHLELDMRTLADENANQICNGEALRVSDYMHYENVINAPNITVTVSAYYKCVDPCTKEACYSTH